MAKKILLIFLICVLSALHINATVYAGSCGTNVKYSLDTSSGVLNITGTGVMTIYSSYSAVPWYSNRSYIKSVDISDSVTSIGDYSFYGCSSLTSVSIGKSVTSIGSSAFSACSKLTSVDIKDIAAWCKITFSGSTSNPLSYAHRLFLNGTEITDLTVPNSVTTIKDYAFYNCSGLTSVTIPESVTSIGSNAFYNCSGLNSASIGNSVTSIGIYAFFGCSGLASASIGNRVTSIGNYAFSGCSKLPSVEIPNSVKTIGNSAFSGCSGLTSASIGNSVTSIGSYAFSGCSRLDSVSIGSSVTSIESSIFSKCSALKKVEIKSNAIVSKTYTSTSTIGNIFGNQVKEYIIGDSVTSIGNYAFYKCDSLASVSIGKSVTSIGSGAFSACSKLTSVDIKDIAAWCKITFSGSDSNPLCYAHRLFLNGTKITDLTVPNSVTTIKDYAFYNCSGLTSVTIPESVTSIGSNAFYNCSAIKSVTIPNNMTEIGGSAFYSCSSLAFVTIPNSITSIGSYAFYGNSSLKKMKMEKNSPINITSNVFNNTSNIVLYVSKGSKSSYASADVWKKFKIIKEFPDGDVNWDGETDVVDVVDIARFVVGTPRDIFDDFLADMNNSGAINVADAVVLVNVIAGDTQFSRSTQRMSHQSKDFLSLLHNNEDKLSMQLEGTERYTAFQFDLWLPSDMNLMSLSLNNLRSQGHQLLYNKVEDGHYRVVVLSTSTETFNGKEGELLSMMLDGFANDDIRIDNIHFVTSQGYDIPFDAVSARYSGTITDIQNIEPANVEKQIEKQTIYDINGQRRESLRKGINIVGGRKVVIK